MSEFEHGESRILLGIGPATGFMAEVGADESLSSSSDTLSCFTGVLGRAGGVSGWKNSCVLPPLSLFRLVDLADRSKAASVMSTT